MGFREIAGVRSAIASNITAPALRGVHAWLSSCLILAPYRFLLEWHALQLETFRVLPVPEQMLNKRGRHPQVAVRGRRGGGPDERSGSGLEAGQRRRAADALAHRRRVSAAAAVRVAACAQGTKGSLEDIASFAGERA